MAFLCCSASQSIKLGFGFHQNPNLISPCSLNLHSPSLFRFNNAAKLPARRKLPLLRVSNKPSEEPIGKAEAITSNDKSTAQGPPFLFILAGIVVFALVLWVVGSIVSWLIGLLRLIFSR